MKEPEKTRKEAVAKPLPIGECWNEQHYESEEIELQVALDVALDSGDFLFDSFGFPIFFEEKIGRYKKKQGNRCSQEWAEDGIQGFNGTDVNDHNQNAEGEFGHVDKIASLLGGLHVFHHCLGFVRFFVWFPEGGFRLLG